MPAPAHPHHLEHVTDCLVYCLKEAAVNQHQQERQLLEMQADILRLKIAAAHIRNRRGSPSAARSLMPEALQLVGQLPVGRLLAAALAKPRRWRHKLWGAALVAALAWWQQR